MKKKIGHVCYWKNVSLIISTLLFCALGYAQELPKNREKFIKESAKIFVDPTMEYNVNQVFPSVVSNTSLLSESSFTRMVDAANAVFSATNDEQLMYYMVCVHVYSVKNKWSSDFLSSWIGIEKDYRTKDVTDYLSFMEFSYRLFRFKALYKDESMTWMFKGSMEWNSDKKLKLICSEGQLIGYSDASSGKDSIYVTETGGVFDFESKKFSGRNGVITWEKTGLKKSETYAELKGYKVNMTSMVLKADSVALTTPYFKTPILGTLTDKSSDQLENEKGTPIFSSYSNRLIIPELKENVDFDGGFTLEGNRVIGSGVKGNPARLIYKFNAKPTLIMSALHFSIEPKRILSREASLKLLYPNGDSLVHESGMFEFDEPKNQVLFTASKKGNSVIPFIDYHFDVTCNAPVLKWEVGTPFPKFTFEMATAQEQKTIRFESVSYFDEAAYKRWGNGAQNPLFQLASYCRKNELKNLTEGNAATAMNQTVEYAKSKLLELSANGFIIYDNQEKMVTPTEKLFAWADAAASGSDYDNIAFSCDLREREIPKQNNESQQWKQYINKLKLMNNRYVNQDFYAFIDLNKDQVFLTGVNEIPLSKAQNATIYPDSTYCILKPNRDLQFNGELFTGKLQVVLKDGYFSYKDFKVKVQHSKYAGLVVNPLAPQDGDQPIELVSSFADLSAEILIDEPNARSGRSKTNKNYPKLLCPNPTKVVYNDPSIVNGSYDSSRFYFLLDPFEMDSLDNFNELSQRFKGVLISGGIFPPIKEPLKIMPDYSLGFSTTAPEGGWAFYGENSKYENKVILSHNGLQGAGTINYSTATAISQKLTFLPDSTIGIAQFVNKESISNVKVPQVSSDAALITFIQKKTNFKGLFMARG